MQIVHVRICMYVHNVYMRMCNCCCLLAFDFKKYFNVPPHSLDLKQAKSLSTNNAALQTNIQKLAADRRLLRAGTCMYVRIVFTL